MFVVKKKKEVQTEEKVKIPFVLLILFPVFRSNHLIIANISNLFIMNKNY